MNERLYKKRTIKVKTCYRLLIIVLVLFWITYMISKVIEPTLVELCRVRAQSIGTSIANEAVQKVMHDVGYLDLIILDRDETGRIMALRANVIEMNRIASTVSEEIQEKNNALEGTFVKIPLGNFTGNIFLSGRGPSVKVKLIPTGTVKIEFKTEFLSTGINQTRHRVYLQVKSKMGIVAPFANSGVEVLTEVNVAETVLIGDVPDTYYNLEGVQDVTTDDSLNMWE
jgi:sporulation protein YunB